jgi:hypothetical protein
MADDVTAPPIAPSPAAGGPSLLPPADVAATPPVADVGAGPSDAPMTEAELKAAIASLSPAEATELLNEFTASFHKPAPPPTLEQCRDGRDAQIRLSALTSDKDWIGRFLAGGAAEKSEFHALTAMVAAAADEGGYINVGELGENVVGEFGVRRTDMIDAISDLSRDGIPPEGIEKILTGSFSDEDVQVAEYELKKLTSNPEWRGRLLAGDAEAKHQFRAWNGVISSRKVL